MCPNINNHHFKFKEKMKKILLTLFATMFVLNVAAQSISKSGTVGNITWNYSKGVLTLTGNGQIPDFDKPTQVPWLSDYTKYDEELEEDVSITWRTKITTINIGEGITKIGNNCFNGAISLTTINFHSTSLTSIGSKAFYGCTALTTINVPESVTEFGTQVFSGCTNLTNTCEHIIINVNRETVGERYTISKDVKYIEGGAFTNCNNLKYLIYEGSPIIGGDIMDGKTRESIKITAMPSNSPNIEETNCGPNRNITKDVNIKKDKYTSYAFLHDVTIPPGVAAYTAKIDGGNVTLTRIKTGKIQAEVGVFLKATNDGEYDFSNGPDAPKADDNDLVGVVEEKQLTKADYAYVLKTDVNGIQKFYLVDSDIKIGKFKAYLTAVGHEAKTFSIFNVDETTNIEETEQEKEEPINSRTEIYNIAGQKLSTTQKGLNIVNGKIVIK